jgi:hypothetical protein
VDGAGAPVKRFCRTILIAAIAIAASAHVGSPDVFFSGSAGPYPLTVRVVPPTVVPGIAWVFIRTAAADLDSIAVTPVYWRAGVKGAPPAERAYPVSGETGLYAQKMWMMSRGSYGVNVEVAGARGRAAVMVPVMALATSRLGVSTPFAAMLIAFGVLLVAGLIAIVRAAASDSLVEPGQEPDQVARRRGSLGAIIAVPVLLVAVFGGARWWKAEDSSYVRTIYRPLAAHATVAVGPRANTLRLSVRDTSSQNVLSSPLMPDHGKMMHLFLVKDVSMSSFAHLHPTRERSGVFVTAIPAVPPGRYLVFGDIALETGAQFTVTTTVDVPVARIDTLSDPDDSWIVDAFGVPATPGARARLGGSLSLQWDTPDSLRAGEDVSLQFSVRDARGQVVPVEPYLGMAGHAVVVRDDASVFIHLHPMGTMSMASRQSFELRGRGDTTAEGRLRDPHAGMSMPAAPEMEGRFSFPYAFPKPGRYRLWVQVKKAGRVMSADYEVIVR